MKKQQESVQGLIVSVHYPTINKSVSVDASKLSEEVRVMAMLHGIKQKLGDAESGKSPIEKFSMSQRIIENMLAGDWELTATRDDSAIIIEAVARVKKVKVAEVQRAIDDSDDGAEKLKEWRIHPKVKAAIAAIRAERAAAAAKDSDADDLDLD
jgi:hypothetical protein